MFRNVKILHWAKNKAFSLQIRCPQEQLIDCRFNTSNETFDFWLKRLSMFLLGSLNWPARAHIYRFDLRREYLLFAKYSATSGKRSRDASIYNIVPPPDFSHATPMSDSDPNILKWPVNEQMFSVSTSFISDLVLQYVYQTSSAYSLWHYVDDETQLPEFIKDSWHTDYVQI